MEGEINKVFKKVLVSFMKDNMNSCASLLDYVEKAKTYSELKRYLTMYGDEIAENLGVDLDEECDDCEYKENRIHDLKEELHNKSFTPKSLDDEYKLDAFVKCKDNFSVSDFESLLD